MILQMHVIYCKYCYYIWLELLPTMPTFFLNFLYSRGLKIVQQKFSYNMFFGFGREIQFPITILINPLIYLSKEVV